MNDLGADLAWNTARSYFETGLGIQFDALICGPKANHDHKISYDRKRKNAPSNRNVTTAKDLVVALDQRYLRYTARTTDGQGMPKPDDEEWYRGCDDAGNHYYISNTDSRILLSETELHIDATFKPRAGLKKYFTQVLTITVRKQFGDGSLISYTCW